MARFVSFQSIFSGDPIRMADLSHSKSKGIVGKREDAKVISEEVKVASGGDIKKDVYVNADDIPHRRYRSLIG